jgi:hypothetical protein
MAAGEYTSLSWNADGSIIARGDSDNDQCGVPTPNSDFVAVATLPAGIILVGRLTSP